MNQKKLKSLIQRYFNDDKRRIALTSGATLIEQKRS